MVTNKTFNEEEITATEFVDGFKMMCDNTACRDCELLCEDGLDYEFLHTAIPVVVRYLNSLQPIQAQGTKIEQFDVFNGSEIAVV